MRWFLVMPSLKISGGVREALRLGSQLIARGQSVVALCMWKSPHAMDSQLPVEQLSEWSPSVLRSVLDLPALCLKFTRWLRKSNARQADCRFIFTHYSTFPLSACVPRTHRYFFVQDLEWRFLGNSTVASLMRRIILFFYRRGKIISANSYLTGALRARGLEVAFETPIWAEAGFLHDRIDVRDVDFVMVLRKGAHKRLDLYLEFLRIVGASGRFRVGVITPEEAILGDITQELAARLLRPTMEEMRALYARSKCFVHLSEHEGFGLPPLEAMGAGCVPLCRDSGGVRSFMDQDPALRRLLVPLTASVREIAQQATRLVSDAVELDALSRRCREVFREGRVAGENISRDALTRLVS